LKQYNDKKQRPANSLFAAMEGKRLLLRVYGKLKVRSLFEVYGKNPPI